MQRGKKHVMHTYTKHSPVPKTDSVGEMKLRPARLRRRATNDEVKEYKSCVDFASDVSSVVIRQCERVHVISPLKFFRAAYVRVCKNH